MKRIALVSALAVLAGCSQAPAPVAEPVQTVEWFKEHDAERSAALEKCRANPGELAGTPNCINAEKAQQEKDVARRGHLKLDAADLNKPTKGT